MAYRRRRRSFRSRRGVPRRRRSVRGRSVRFRIGSRM